MSILPPLVPELDGSRPAAASVGPATGTIRLGARVVAIAGAHVLIETGHGRTLLLQGAPSLRPGASLVLELQHADPAPARTGRLLEVGQQRLEPPLPVRLQPASRGEAAAIVRTAAPLEVGLRALGPDHKPVTPVFTARLVVPLPQPGPVAAGSIVSIASPPVGGVAAARALPDGRGAADAALPTNSAVASATSRPAAQAASSTEPNAGNGATRAAPATAPIALPEQLGALTAQNRGAIEAIVLPRDALGRALLRAAGFTFEVDTPVELPVGARLQLTLPARPARASAAPLHPGPLEAARALAASLREPAALEQPGQTGTLRLPEPDDMLAARLLRLVQLIAPRPGEADRRGRTEPATEEGPPGAARVAAALAELGRLAAEPQGGGWRMLLLPLGFPGAPLLRLYLREDPCAEDGCGKERQTERLPPARRAVFQLEFGELGRCQIDVLCQARRFDLVVRTEQLLPPRVRRELRELYLAARDVAGLVGEVRFRAGQLLAVPEPAGAGGPGGGLTV